MNTGTKTLLVAMLCLFAANAQADVFHWDLARWRVEFTAWNGIKLGSVERGDDRSLSFAVEREVPISDRITTGVRLFPLFVYSEDRSNETIFGAGAGVQLRLYFKKNRYRGMYLEGGTSFLLHSEKFERNSTQWNFMSEAGLGYQFERGITVAVKYRHISNAGLGDRNSGIDALGLGVGFAF
jgi:hypothetical protein